MEGQTPLKIVEIWQIAASIATIAQAILVVISLVLIWFQIRQQTRQTENQTKQSELQTKLAEASFTQAIFEIASPFNIQVIQNRDMAELICNGHKNYDSYDEVDKLRYRNSIMWRLTFQETLYYQNKNELINKDIYRGWEVDFKAFVRRRHLEARWDELQVYYTSEFIKYVSDALKSVAIERAQNRVLTE